MNYNEFAETVKRKYPQYADRDNRMLAEAMIKKYPQYADRVTFDAPIQEQPKWYEIEKQEGLPKTAGGLVKQVGGAVMRGVTSPIPLQGLESVLPAQQLSGQFGADVARAAEPKIGTVPARAAGFVASMATDPTTYAGMKLPAPGASALGKAVEARLPALFKGLAKVPEVATETLIKEGGNLPKPTAVAEEALTNRFRNIFDVFKKKAEVPEVAQGIKDSVTKKVQDALSGAVAEHGQALNEAKRAVGLPVDVAEKEASLQKFGNVFGVDTAVKKEVLNVLGPSGKEIVAAIDQTPEAIAKPTSKEGLVKAILDFKKNAERLTDQTRVKMASYLQDRINNYVNWEKPGDQLEGVLKSQYGDLAELGFPKALKESKAEMKEALDLLGDLKKKIGEEPGKAQSFLQRLFTKDTPVNRDYIAKLAKLEAVSGKPILSTLKDTFTPRSAPAATQEVIDALERKIGQGPGATQKFLQKVFTSDDPMYKDVLQQFKKVEEATGQKFVGELKKYFAGKSFDKWASRPGTEMATAAFGAGAALLGHPVQAALSALALAGQSPKLLAAAVKHGPKALLPIKAAQGVGFAASLRPGFALSEKNKRELQSLRDRLRNNAK